MEELEPPKPRAKWRHWVKPIVFTTLLYAGLGGSVYYFYGNKQSDSDVKKVVVTPINTNDVVAPTTSSVSADVISSAQDPNTISPNPQNPNAQPAPIVQAGVLPTLNAPTGNNQIPKQGAGAIGSTVNLTPSNTPQNTRRIHQGNQVIQTNPVPQTEPVLNGAPPQSAPTPPKPDPKSKALTKAEEDAEAQNELLREAINKVRQINDNKIAKARENTESSIPAHQPIIKDGSDEPSAEPKKPKDPPKKETSKKEVAKKEPVKQDPPKKDTADSSSKADPAPADGADSGQDGGGAE